MKEIKGNRRKGLPTVVLTDSDRAETDAARGLTPEVLDSIMLEANSGDPRRQARLCRDILERDWSIGQALQTRINAVLGCSWHLEAGDGTPEAEEAARALERQFVEAGGSCEDGVFGINEFLEEMEHAILPGYAVFEKCWTGGGDFAGFASVPQTAILFRDGETRIILEDSPAGIPLDSAHYIFHRAIRRGIDPARGGLVRPLAWLFCFANIGIKDLTAFIERHGMPFIVGKVDQGGVEQERNAVKRLIRNFGPSGGGVFSRNVEVQLMESTSKGEVYFQLLNYLDDAVTKLILGQTASSGDSAGLSGGDAQSKVRQDILEADCRRISSCIQRQLIPQWMAFNAPMAAPPRFILEYEAPEDRAQLAQVVSSLASAGFLADAEELSQRFGMKLTYREPQQSSGGFPMGAEGEEKKAGGNVTDGFRRSFQPVVKGVSELIECEDTASFRKKLMALCEELSDAEYDTSALEKELVNLEATGIASGAEMADMRLRKAVRKRKFRK